MKKRIYDLKLHEDININGFTNAIRVAGGWIYIFIDTAGDIVSSCFVPFNNEFQKINRI